MIYLISTSANVADNYERRKQEYINGLCSLVYHYQVNPYIIEAYQTDYLSEDYRAGAVYSENKGVNEFILIDNFFGACRLDIKDDDDVIKTTLRYQVTDSSFFDLVKSNTHDVYCKLSKDIYGPQDTGVHSFLFSMKWHCWKEFLSSFNRNMPKDHPIESQLSQFVRTKNTKFVDRLGMLAAPSAHGRIYSV